MKQENNKQLQFSKREEINENIIPFPKQDDWSKEQKQTSNNCKHYTTGITIFVFALIIFSNVFILMKCSKGFIVNPYKEDKI